MRAPKWGRQVLSILVALLIVLSPVPPVFPQLLPPTLLQPENNSWVNDNTPLFDWTDVSGADGYQILVDNDPNFTSPEINDFPSVSQYVPIIELQENVLYHWKVRARNTTTGDSSDWSTTWVFRVDITPPSAPSLISPENNVTLYVDQPVFEWTPVSDLSGVSYKLEIDNDSNFSSPVYSILLTSTSHQIENKLVENFSPYYWRVVAIDGARNENSSPTRIFWLKVPPSSRIDPISPYWKNASFTISATASDNDGRVENVEFWFRYSPDNVTWGNWILYDNDSTSPYSVVFVPPSGDGFYEFYSRAWDDRRNYELPPDVADAICGYDTTAPPAVENLLPENNADIINPNVTLQWGRVTDLSGVSYEVLVDNEENFSSPYVFQATNLSENRVTTSTLSPGVYFWKVRAVDGAGNAGSWSLVYSFTVRTWWEIESISGNSFSSASWSRLEGWQTTVNGLVGWVLVEDWTSSLTPLWFSLDSMAVAVRTSAGWETIESEAVLCGTQAHWSMLELILGEAVGFSNWSSLEAIASGVELIAVWRNVDSIDAHSQTIQTNWYRVEAVYGSNCTITQWRTLDCYVAGSWTFGGWAMIEDWNMRVSTPSNWRRLSEWTGSTMSVSPEWREIEECFDGVSTTVEWQILEACFGMVQSMTRWLPIGSWILTLRSPASWQPAEDWSVRLFSPWRWISLDSCTGVSKAPVPAPVLSAPSDWENTSNTTPTFVWENSLPADNFELQVDNDADFSLPEIWVVITSTSYTPATGLVDNLYYWRVRQWRSNSSSPWSSVRRLRVDTIAPDKPIFVSPGEGENDNYVPTLRWVPPPENSLPLVYRLQISTSPYFETVRVDTGWTINDNFWTPSALEDNLYYWRVAAMDNAGNSGAFSSARSFRIDRVAPSVPTSLLPDNGATVEKTPVLSWASVQENSLPVVYMVQVAQTSDFTVGLIQSSTTENFWICPPLEETVWYWRVRARDNAGNYSPWTDTRWFLVSPRWRPLESLTSSLGALVSWRINETWTPTILSAPAWRPVDVWTVAVNTSASWRLVDARAGEICRLGMWASPESWTAQVSTSVAWWMIEDRTVLSKSPTTWAVVEFWAGIAPATVLWQPLENMVVLANAMARWYWTEEWTIHLGMVAYWSPIEQFSSSASVLSQWREIQVWTLICVSPSAWRFEESVSGGILLPVNWLFLDRFQDQAIGLAGWSQLENSAVVVIISLVDWSQLDSFTDFMQAHVVWRLHETWSDTASSQVTWVPVDQLMANLRTRVSWLGCEQWSGICLAILGQWRTLEAWQAASPTTTRWTGLEFLQAGAPAVALWTSIQSLSGVVSAPIYPPVLYTPENAANTNDNTPTFSWGTSQPVDAFELQVYNDGDFSSPEVSVVIAENSYTPSSSLPDNQYWWRVRCRRTGVFSPWSEVRVLRIDTLPPAAPSLQDPADGIVVNDPTPLLRWTRPLENSLPLTYNLRISTSPYFEPANIVLDLWVGDNAYEVSGLQENVTYYWKVCARDNAGNVGSFPTAWRFKIDTLPPAAPVIISPENGGWAAPAAVLKWQAVAENSPPVLYRVEISDFPDFLNLVRVAEVYDNYWTVSPPLPVSSYYWRVRARDNALNWGSWSSVYWFKVDNDPPLATLLSPENEAHVQAGSPVIFRFTGDDGTGSGVGSYTVQISQDPSFTQVYIEVTVSENSFTTTLPQGTLYWRVRAIDRVGNIGTWSNFWVLYSSDWTALDSLIGLAQGGACWIGTDYWSPRVEGAAAWHRTDLLQGRIENVAYGWLWLDSFVEENAIGVHYWASLETWSCKSVGAANWCKLDLLNFSMAVPPSFWTLQEDWAGECLTEARFEQLESMNGEMSWPVYWVELENLEGTCVGVHYWVALESFIADVVNRQWRTVEKWSVWVRAPASFRPLENLLGRISVLPSEWNICESLVSIVIGRAAYWNRLEVFSARSRPPAWSQLETWEETLPKRANWCKIDWRGGEIKSPVYGYSPLERCSGKVCAPHIWVYLTGFEGSVASPISWKKAVESAYMPKFMWFKLEESSGSAWAPRWIEERKEQSSLLPEPTKVEVRDLSPSLDLVVAIAVPPSFKVSVGESSYLPLWLPKPKGEIYAYFDLVAENAQPVLLRVKIKKSWLRQVDRNTLRILGHRGSWREIEFEEVREDEEFLYLEFRPEGFNCFAITAKRPPYSALWAVVWVWIGVVGTLCCLIVYPHLSEFRARRLERKYAKVLRGPLLRRISIKLRTIARKLPREERDSLRSLMEELEAIPPRLIPVEEKLTPPELVAVRTLERFIRERRKRVPLKKEKVEELKKLQEEMLKRRRKR